MTNRKMLAESVNKMEYMTEDQLNEFWVLINNMSEAGDSSAKVIVENINYILKETFGINITTEKLATWITAEATKLDEGAVNGIWKVGRIIDKAFSGTKAADKIVGKGVKAVAKRFAKDGASSALNKLTVAGAGAAAAASMSKKKKPVKQDNAKSIEEGAIGDVWKAGKWLGKKLINRGAKKLPSIEKGASAELDYAPAVIKPTARPMRNASTSSSKFDGPASNLPYNKPPVPKVKGNVPSFLKKQGPGKINTPMPKPIAKPIAKPRINRIKSKQADINKEIGSDLLNVGALVGGAAVAVGAGKRNGTLPAGQSPKTSVRPKQRPIKSGSVNEGVLDDIDDAGFMAKRQLYDIAKFAITLHKSINDSDELEPWVQAKIDKAAECIESIKQVVEFGSDGKDEYKQELFEPEIVETYETYETDETDDELTPCDVLRFLKQRRVITQEQADTPADDLIAIVQDVAEFYSPVDELGSSDISAIIRMVVSDAINSDVKLDGDRVRNYIQEGCKTKDSARRIYEKMTIALRT